MADENEITGESTTEVEVDAGDVTGGGDREFDPRGLIEQPGDDGETELVFNSGSGPRGEGCIPEKQEEKG